MSDRHRRILSLIGEYQTTQEDLEEFRANRHLLDQIAKLEAEAKAKDEEIALQRKKIMEYKIEEYMSAWSRSTSEGEIDKANLLLSEEGEHCDMGEWTSGNAPIDVKELFALADEFCRYPSRNIDIIKLLRERRQSRPKIS
jgi:hypothetical protein